MGLFKKYFGQDDHDTRKNQLSHDEMVSEYINAVNYIANLMFYYETINSEYLSPDDEDLSLLVDLENEDPEKYKKERLKYDKEILKTYEPKIISLVILGYYMLNDLKCKEECHGSIQLLLKNNKLFRSVVLRFIEPIARSRGELFFTMERSVKSNLDFTDLVKRMTSVLIYFQDRFYKYDIYIINGLDCFLKDPEHYDNDSFYKAYSFYINPPEQFPNSNTDYHYITQDAFPDCVYMAYYHLQQKLSHG